ncbi:hypothetical protein [Sporisorium scitamineum]|uniref:Uncharacterized protein n=1 Tax=Sporisorium scitamineum TaxID=49012 RepID=A0A0F7S7K7_9BASI|nr:hypothetical protein [Sporisorium scitamineum]
MLWLSAKSFIDHQLIWFILTTQQITEVWKEENSMSPGFSLLARQQSDCSVLNMQ